LKYIFIAIKIVVKFQKYWNSFQKSFRNIFENFR